MKRSDDQEEVKKEKHIWSGGNLVRMSSITKCYAITAHYNY